jgi:hypothetical protein
MKIIDFLIVQLTSIGRRRTFLPPADTVHGVFMGSESLNGRSWGLHGVNFMGSESLIRSWGQSP